MSAPGEQLLGRGPVMPLSVLHLSQSTRWTISAIGLFCVILVGSIAARYLQDPIRFPVSNVDVLGTLDYEDRGDLIQAVEQYTGEGFYGLDIRKVRRAVEALPWVASARISRVWPGRIEVQVEEHEPAARWNADSLVSKRLELFMPPQLQLDNPRYLQWREVFSSLPRIEGAPGRHGALLDTFRDYELRLKPFGVKLAALVEDERRSQSLELSNQITVRLGYVDRELRMSRFLDVFGKLSPKLGAMSSSDNEPGYGSATFDMRYANGFALGGVGGSRLAGELAEYSPGLLRGPVQ